MADKKESMTERWAKKNKNKAKPSDLGKGAAKNAAEKLKNRKSQLDSAIDGYTINGKKVK